MRFSSLSDEQLLKDAAAGKDSAFEELMERQGQRLFNFLLRMCGHEEVAGRLFEEIWVEMWKLRGSQAAASNLGIALFSLAARKAARHFVENPPPLHPPLARDHPDASSLAWRGSRLQEALNALPMKERAALLLCFFDSFSYAQAATCLSEREEHARELAGEGLRRLKAQLGPDFLGSGLP